MPERVRKEIKHRTRVATPFPNEASLLRLVSPSYAVLGKNDVQTGLLQNGGLGLYERNKPRSGLFLSSFGDAHNPMAQNMLGKNGLPRVDY